jgi:hypothetical protein
MKMMKTRVLDLATIPFQGNPKIPFGTTLKAETTNRKSSLLLNAECTEVKSSNFKIHKPVPFFIIALWHQFFP